MRGSAVVLGLKSFASKLHPQLPLGPKESQKLFVALTTAFQQELDQAHPRQADDDATPPGSQLSGTTKASIDSKQTSSATLADRHLAAVLTNPLLAPRAFQTPVLDINSARAALREDPTRDAVSILEDYEKRGAASIPLAAVCLEAHNRKIDSVPEKDRSAFIVESAAGKRSLLWLWRSECLKDPLFYVESSAQFRASILLLLVREGEEEFLRRCLEREVSPFGPPQIAAKRYNWKTQIYTQIIVARLIQQNFASANGALDALFGFFGEKHAFEKIRTGEGLKIKIGGAMMRLCQLLLSNRTLRAGTDPARFDRLLETLLMASGDRGLTRLTYAQLCVIHPRSPTPFPALLLLRETFESSAPDKEVRERFVNPASERIRLRCGRFLATTAAQLQSHAQSEDAEWVLSLAKRLYPKDEFPDKSLPLHSNTRHRSPMIEADITTSQDLLLPSVT